MRGLVSQRPPQCSALSLGHSGGLVFAKIATDLRPGRHRCGGIRAGNEWLTRPLRPEGSAYWLRSVLSL